MTRLKVEGWIMSEDNAIVTEQAEVSEPAYQEQQSTQPVQAEQTVETEKMVPQSKVNEIVGATKKTAYEKAYQEALNQIQSQQDRQAEIPQQTQSEHVDVEKLVSDKIGSYFDDLQRLQMEEAAKQSAQKTLESLQAKVETAQKKYDDFEEVTKDIPYASFPNLLAASDDLDNAGEVLYHLGKNPSKMREIATAFQMQGPVQNLAMRELRALSESLKNNEAAKNKSYGRDPLSQITPSNVSNDSGKLSRQQLRQKWRV